MLPTEGMFCPTTEKKNKRIKKELDPIVRKLVFVDQATKRGELMISVLEKIEELIRLGIDFPPFFILSATLTHLCSIDLTAQFLLMESLNNYYAYDKLHSMEKFKQILQHFFSLFGCDGQLEERYTWFKIIPFEFVDRYFHDLISLSRHTFSTLERANSCDFTRLAWNVRELFLDPQTSVQVQTDLTRNVKLVLRQIEVQMRQHRAFGDSKEDAFKEKRFSVDDNSKRAEILSLVMPKKTKSEIRTERLSRCLPKNPNTSPVTQPRRSTRAITRSESSPDMKSTLQSEDLSDSFKALTNDSTPSLLKRISEELEITLQLLNIRYCKSVGELLSAPAKLRKFLQQVPKASSILSDSAWDGWEGLSLLHAPTLEIDIDELLKRLHDFIAYLTNLDKQQRSSRKVGFLPRCVRAELWQWRQRIPKTFGELLYEDFAFVNDIKLIANSLNLEYVNRFTHHQQRQKKHQTLFHSQSHSAPNVHSTVSQTPTSPPKLRVDNEEDDGILKAFFAPWLLSPGTEKYKSELTVASKKKLFRRRSKVEEATEMEEFTENNMLEEARMCINRGGISIVEGCLLIQKILEEFASRKSQPNQSRQGYCTLGYQIVWRTVRQELGLDGFFSLEKILENPLLKSLCVMKDNISQTTNNLFSRRKKKPTLLSLLELARRRFQDKQMKETGFTLERLLDRLVSDSGATSHILSNVVVQTSLMHLKLRCAIECLTDTDMESCWEGFENLSFDAVISGTIKHEVYQRMLAFFQQNKNWAQFINQYSVRSPHSTKHGFGLDKSFWFYFTGELEDYREDNTATDTNLCTLLPYLDGSFIEVSSQLQCIFCHAPEGIRHRTAFMQVLWKFQVQYVISLNEPKLEKFHPIYGSGQYWPDETQNQIMLLDNGFVTRECQDQHLMFTNDTLEFVTVRRLKIWMRGKMKHCFTQFHARCMEDFSASTLNHLTAFLDFVETRMNAGSTILIHCHGGVGRTGSIFLMLAARSECRRLFETNSSITLNKMWTYMEFFIKAAIPRLRLQRSGAVQSDKQIEMIYQVTAFYIAKLLAEKTQESITCLPEIQLDPSSGNKYCSQNGVESSNGLGAGEIDIISAIGQLLTGYRTQDGWLRSRPESTQNGAQSSVSMQCRLEALATREQLFKWNNPRDQEKSTLGKAIRFAFFPPSTGELSEQQKQMRQKQQHCMQQLATRLAKANFITCRFLLRLMNSAVSFWKLFEIIEQQRKMNVTDPRNLWQLLASGEVSIIEKKIELHLSSSPEFLLYGPELPNPKLIKFITVHIWVDIFDGLVTEQLQQHNIYSESDLGSYLWGQQTWSKITGNEYPVLIEPSSPTPLAIVLQSTNQFGFIESES